MGLSGVLRERHAAIWARIVAHPFVRGLADGTLPADRFRFYMAQDYVYLIEYGRVLALAAAQSPDLATMTRFAEFLDATLGVEMALHRAYAARFGLTPEELAATELAPTAHAYTRHLLAVARAGALVDICFALLPCAWGYWELGQRLAAEPRRAAGSPYEEWIRAYSSPEYGALATWLRDLADRLAAGLPDAELARLGEHYRASARYELAFWQMAWAGESWPA